MRKVFFHFIIIVNLLSCKLENSKTNIFSEKLNSCDEILVTFPAVTPFPETTHLITDSSIINQFKMSISGENDIKDNSCISNGILTFKEKGTVLLQANFSTLKLNRYKENCQFIKYSLGSNSFTSKLPIKLSSYLEKTLHLIYNPPPEFEIIETF